MFNNINNRLLTRWPLVWNTRVLWAVLSLLVLHLLFYLMGRGAYGSVHELVEGRYYRGLGEIYNLWLLVAFLFFVVWLVFYFRNNAFKSMYPVSRWYLFREYLFILLVCFLACTLYISAQAGYRNAVVADTKDFDLVQDSKTMNLAACFLPATWDEYEIANSCDSVRAHDLGYVYDEPAERFDYCDTGTQEVYEEEIPADVKPPMQPRANQYSYLFYCGKQAHFDGLTQYWYHDKAQRWLLNEERDSIAACLQKFKNLCKQYGLVNTLDVADWTNRCFTDTLFTVTITMEEHFRNREYTYGEFMFYSDISGLMNAIDDFRIRPLMNKGEWYGFMYMVVVVSLAIFSFRITRLRAWLMSVIGGLLWVIVFMFTTIWRDFDAFASMVFVLAAAFLVVAVFLIAQKKFKTFAAMLLCWFMAIWILVVPLAFQLIYMKTFERTECIGNKLTVVYAEPPIHGWIDNNWTIINAGNVALTLVLLFFLIIPLAIRWQSNPEE